MSNTIIMYENGKAVGGEGHPTDADEITFDNEDTDLVSEEVESAIKEVNAKFDKDIIGVTGNGVKTIAALLNELYPLIDFTKVKPTTILRRINTATGNFNNFTLTVNAVGNMLQFGQVAVAGATYELSTIVIANNASSWNRFNAPSSYSNLGTTVENNGYRYEIIY